MANPELITNSWLRAETDDGSFSRGKGCHRQRRARILECLKKKWRQH